MAATVDMPTASANATTTTTDMAATAVTMEPDDMETTMEPDDMETTMEPEDMVTGTAGDGVGGSLLLTGNLYLSFVLVPLGCILFS